jgi:hypothetical protein
MTMVSASWCERCVLALALSSFAPASALSQAPPPRSWRIAGDVLSEQGRPVQGARVQLVSDKGATAQSRTDQNGSFELTITDMEDWPLGGYVLQVRPGTIIAGASVVLPPSGKRCRVTLRDASGQDYAGCCVEYKGLSPGGRTKASASIRLAFPEAELHVKLENFEKTQGGYHVAFLHYGPMDAGTRTVEGVIEDPALLSRVDKFCIAAKGNESETPNTIEASGLTFQ